MRPRGEATFASASPIKSDAELPHQPLRRALTSGSAVVVTKKVALVRERERETSPHTVADGTTCTTRLAARKHASWQPSTCLGQRHGVKQASRDRPRYISHGALRHHPIRAEIVECHHPRFSLPGRHVCWPLPPRQGLESHILQLGLVRRNVRVGRRQEGILLHDSRTNWQSLDGRVKAMPHMLKKHTCRPHCSRTWRPWCCTTASTSSCCRRWATT